MVKLLATSKYYFYNAWNVFDFFIVIVSLIEVSLEDIELPSLSVFRTFRLVSSKSEFVALKDIELPKTLPSFLISCIALLRVNAGELILESSDLSRVIIPCESDRNSKLMMS